MRRHTANGIEQNLMSLYCRRISLFVARNRPRDRAHFLRRLFGVIGHLFSRYNSCHVCAVSKAIGQRSVAALRNIARVGKVGVEWRSGIDVPVKGKMRMI